MTRALNPAAQLAHLQQLHGEYTAMACDLVRQIEDEENRVGSHNPTHFRYPAFCTAGRVRLKALHKSIDDLDVRIADLELGGTGCLRMAGQGDIPLECEMDGAGREAVWRDGSWRSS